MKYKINTDKIRGWIDKGAEKLDEFQRQRTENRIAKEFANEALGEIAYMLKDGLDRAQVNESIDSLQQCSTELHGILVNDLQKDTLLKVAKGLRANAKVLEKLAKTIEGTDDVEEIEEIMAGGAEDCD